ncbi:N-acetylmuramoyl-L-alanine amidase [Pedobacter sp. SYSU D00535]|uniref:N-acetylmuramoyl-L-alanine amidase family protein n=1 Tax=Pedobacter sp. SYSU D00535 TaxID=2810308 RepID=UPI001A9598BF|nr:N-acetylmuramoyl-L-alanine amidase [Pedobacter sp. SYSU D00535]
MFSTLFKDSQKVFPLILVFFLNSLSGSYASGRFDCIVIDAGHGGADGVTRGLISREKDITLKVALKLGKAIKAKYPSIKVYYTRTSDVQVPLYKRIALANRVKADLFISLHCNSLPSSSKNRSQIRGTETFVSGFNRLKEQDVAIRENASILLEKDYKKNYDGYDPKDPASIIVLSLIKNSNREQSIKVAQLIQKEFRKAGRLDRGVKEQSLAVLAKAAMPAVLTELGFISNPTEEKYMNSWSGQQQLVNCLVNAVEKFKETID